MNISILVCKKTQTGGSFLPFKVYIMRYTKLNLIMPDNHKNIAARIVNAYAERSHSPQDEAEFLSWLTDPRDEAGKTEALENLWDAAGRKNRINDAEMRAALKKARMRLGINRSAKPVFALYRTGMARAAAILLVLIIVGTALIVRESSSAEIITIAAADSVQHRVLPDGTDVWLNCDSELTYSENRKNTRLASLRGEAYFDVHNNGGSPFVINTEKITVEVFGTKFNMKESVQEGYSRVSLHEGELEIRSDAGAVAMLPGSRVNYSHATKKLNRTLISEDERDWRYARLVFIKENIADILKQVAGYYRMRLVIDKGVSMSDNISIRFDGTEEIEEVMFLLSQLSDGLDHSIDKDRNLTIFRNP